ncbi:UNVERIFIED_CONTAM: hypothetical protein GTU68_041591 [Idotea baltica]|nr:hypothetical protein [Idotea baltica]
MEIVLGIDNIVFITIVSGRLPKEQQPLARRLGLALALISRLLLLFALFYMVNGEQFKTPLFKLTDLGVPTSLVESGLFLVGKSVYEIHDEFGHGGEHEAAPTSNLFVSVLIQIALLDIVFSLDSVITAVGMVEEIWIMVTAIILAVTVMLVFAEPVSRFVESHPTLKILALSFLILIGVMLVAEGVGAHMDKGYIYFAMFFALLVEIINISIRSKTKVAAPSDPSAA